MSRARPTRNAIGAAAPTPPVPMPVMAVPRPLPLTVTVDQRPIVVPAVDDQTLWDWLAVGDWGAIIGLLDLADRTWIGARLRDRADRFDAPDVARLAQHVLCAPVGLPWWACVRVASLATSHRFGFTIWCVRHHVDAPTLALPLRVAAVVAWAYDVAEDTDALARQLWTPPPGVPRWDTKTEAATFAAAQASAAAARARQLR